MSSFIKSINDIMANGKKATTFYDAEMLTFYWETSPEIIARLLPPPLKPADRPLVHAFIANYPHNNFCPPYMEAGLFILADYKGELGTYCLSMPITDGIGMALGREYCALPKKMAQIDIKKDEKSFEGAISRHGINFATASAKLGGKLNSPDGMDIIKSVYGEGLPIFNVKYSFAVDGSGYDIKPVLQKQSLIARDVKAVPAEVSLKLVDSPHDPWAELEVTRMLGGVYTVSTNILGKGTILEAVDPMSFLPYSQLKWDWWGDTL